MPGEQLDWGGSLHQTFRILPEAAEHLRPFLEAEGLTPTELLGKLPYHAARAATPGEGPDPKRYRDPKQVYQTVGLVFEGDDGRVHVTELGLATLRWLDIITTENAPVLGRHVAFALASCQLRNPTRAGQKYDASMEVFPFSFIWRAMLALDLRIASEELNRAILRVRNEKELTETIERIRRARAKADLTLLGEEVVTGQGKNDRLIAWMSLASFGWLLFQDKKSTGSEYFTITRSTLPILREAARVRHRHRDFASTEEYVRYVSGNAALPRDLR